MEVEPERECHDEKVGHVQGVLQEDHAKSDGHQDKLNLEDQEDGDAAARKQGVQRMDFGVLVLVATCRESGLRKTMSTKRVV